MGMVDWDALIVNGIISKAPALAPQRDELGEIYTSSESYRLRDMVFENPALIGKTQDIKILADANVDVWVRGQIDRDLPDEQQQLSPEVRKLADEMEAQGVLTTSFNTQIFTNPDSRSSPATSGLAGAFMGSLFMMLIVIFISIPIGVASAIYLEEFAPKNYITDIIEVNINNLAAVPSIVFGLLGAAIFIGWMHLPLSSSCIRFGCIPCTNYFSSCVTSCITRNFNRCNYWGSAGTRRNSSSIIDWYECLCGQCANLPIRSIHGFTCTDFSVAGQ